jgi:iron complex outermembrane receptor protein
MHNLDTRLRGIRTSVAGAVALALLGASAQAQESTTTPSADTDFILEEITITGTRIKQRNDYVAPNPITTFSSNEMQNLGLVNIADAVIQMPANISNFQVANTGGNAFFVGSTLANLRGLNPFFGTRTLTLVDSRRFVPTNQGGSVDLNFIPSILIDRVEVVTGGASAAYGSEAVSGVVNIMLNRTMQGFRFEADYGASTHGDSGDRHFGAAGGMDLFDGRGHIVFGGEYQEQDLVASCSHVREWCARSVSNFTNFGTFFDAPGTPYEPEDALIPGQPQNVILENRRQSQVSRTGVFWTNSPTATTTLQVNEAGTGLGTPFNVGQFSYQTPGAAAVGGDGRSVNDGLTLTPEVERATVYSHMTYDFTDSLQGFAELSFGEVTALNPQNGAGGFGSDSVNLCINADNAFLAGNPGLQGAVAAAAANQTGSFTCSPFGNAFAQFGSVIMRKDFTGQTNQRVTTDTEVVRGALGLQGPLAGSWTWDGYYQFGRTKRAQIGNDYRTNHRFTMAVDSIIDPRPTSPTFGQPVCRVTVTGTANTPFQPTMDNIIPAELRAGCQPLNPFGLDTMSEGAKAYAFGDLTEFNTIKQHVVSLNTSGGLWRGWGAGPLIAAVGAEYRMEELENLAGDRPFAPRTDFIVQYGDAFAGETKVTEGFVELEMPLLRDKPAAKLWMVNGAVRQAHYKTEGGLGTTGETGTQDITTWKVSSVWDPLKWLRVRGSTSRDVRAAGFRELYYSQRVPAGPLFTFGNIMNPWRTPDVDDPNDPFDFVNIFQQNEPSEVVLAGTPELDPESAETDTLGIVLTGSGALQGLSFSADYYQITLEDGIVGGNTFNIIDECFNADINCDLITFGAPDPDPSQAGNPLSNIVSVRAPYINAQPYKATGVDLSLDYNLPLNKLFESAKGNLFFRLIGTRALEMRVRTATRDADIAGQTGGDSGFFSDFTPAPDWAANLVISYLNGPLTFTTQGRYTSKGVLDKQTPKTGPDDAGFNPLLAGTVTDNTLPSFMVWNISGSYDFKIGSADNVQVFATMNNIFDKEPPYASGSVGGANPIFFDTAGRTYRLGVRVRL